MTDANNPHKGRCERLAGGAAAARTILNGDALPPREREGGREIDGERGGEREGGREREIERESVCEREREER